MHRTLQVFFFYFICLSPFYAQVGGDNVYEFLNLPASARITGLGGNLITVVDDDASLAFHNPALLNPLMHQQIAFSTNIHFAGINNGYAVYAHYHKKWNTTFQGGLSYITYGKFTAADEFGQIQGQFKASEYALTLGAARPLYEKMTIGANLKFISSQLEAYRSFGLLADLSAVYQDTAKGFVATLLFKNMGTQLSTYRVDNVESIPYDIQFGVSKKLRYLPFRFSFIMHDLQRWNITYDDPNTEETGLFFGELPQAKGKFGPFVDNLFRHFIFNGEFLLGRKENFRIRFGYNHFRRKELSVDRLRSIAGFSLGFGFKIKRFRIDYGRNFYHLAGSVNHFSISTSLKEFRK
ncbi:MAG TPA: type IX secretion system protein PorQ [Saprospiraceae bacterium]|nr:type IX secretion system protein PorQ [Saprospiraceae bacterium]